MKANIKPKVSKFFKQLKAGFSISLRTKIFYRLPSLKPNFTSVIYSDEINTDKQTKLSNLILQFLAVVLQPFEFRHLVFQFTVIRSERHDLFL